MKPLSRLPLLLAFGVLFLSCAYFNTFYNAQRYFEEATKEIRESEKASSISKKTEDALDRTIEKTTAVLAKYPDSRYRDDALMLQGKAHYYKGDYVRALESFQQVVNEEIDSPFEDEASLWIVRCTWKLGDLQSALVNLRQVLQRTPKTSGDELPYGTKSLGHETAAEIYMAQKNLDSAIVHFQESAKYQRSGSERSRLYSKIAELSFGNSRYDTASEFYSKVIQSSTNIKHLEKAHLQIVKMARLQKRWDEATTEIQTLLSDAKFTEIRPQLYLELAKLYEMQSRTKEAMTRYELITQEFPRTQTSAEAYFELGRLTLETGGSYEEAKKYYQRVGREARSSIFAPSAGAKVREINAITELIEQIEDLQNQLAALRTAESQEISYQSVPDSADSLLGDLAIPDPEETATRESKRDSIGILNELAEKLYSYGELLAFHLQNPDSATGVFERLVTSMPTSPRRAQALFSLTYLYRQKGLTDEAEAYANQLILEYPLTEYAEKVSLSLGFEIRDTAEDILMEAERLLLVSPDAAVRTYQRILDEFPSSRFVPSALLAIANLYDYRLNDLENSLAYYERLTMEFPESEQSRSIEERYLMLKEQTGSLSDTSRSGVSEILEEENPREN